jgi:tetrahydromethanopterin S-methyltransferase subunit A
MLNEIPDLPEALRQLRSATEASKCWACNCFRGSLAVLEQGVPDPQRDPALNEAIAAARAVLSPVRYECLGCDPCYPPQALAALGVEGDACDAAPVAIRSGWPPLPGQYHVLRYVAPVAICTLTDDTLADRIAAASPPAVSIVGSLQTENLGIERLLTNVIANPHIRILLLCGADTRKAVGHLPGASLLATLVNGIDADGRIIGAPGRRPILKNIEAAAVAHARATILAVDRIGTVDVAAILAEAAAQAASAPGPAEPYQAIRSVDTVAGTIPDRMVSDPAGYAVIDVDRARRHLVLEHYTTAGVLDCIVSGQTADEVMTPAFTRGLVSRLDHAGYLGKELARAEAALHSGAVYVQDAAPERLQPEESAVTPAACGTDCGCRPSAPRLASHPGGPLP